jgi:hypothetical protein
MRVLFVIAICLSVHGNLTEAAPPPGDQLLSQQLEMIKPTWRESSWSQIPWMLDLTAARNKAAAEGKPLFVWSMSGEALGQC